MSNLAALTNSFQQVGIDNTPTNYHELRIEYPVLDLLPPEQNVRPFLSQPTNMWFREKPDGSKFHLPLTGTDFVAHLATGDRRASIPDVGLKPFSAALARLADAPGQSLLQIATYLDPYKGEMYRFRLLVARDGESQLVLETELDNIALAAEESACGRLRAARLVRDLLTRKSDRAYFHVHERLRHYRWYKEQVAREAWDIEGGFDAKRCLARNVQVVVRCRDTVRNVPVNRHDFEGQGEGTFLLPCGHQQHMTLHQLSSMSDKEAFSFACSRCGKKVMQDEDFVRFRLWSERTNRDIIYEKEMMWQKLEGDFPLGLQHVNAHSSVLHQALRHADSSIFTPRSASPPELHPLYSQRFNRIRSCFFTQAPRTYLRVDCTSAELYNCLLAFFDKTVGFVDENGAQAGNFGSLSPDSVLLVQLWLRRTAQLLSVPGYDGRAIHEVAGQVVAEDDASMEARRALGELVENMRGAQLGEKSESLDGVIEDENDQDAWEMTLALR